MREPVIPKFKEDPTGLKTKVAKAEADFRRRIKGAFAKIIKDVYLTLEPKKVKINESARHFIGNAEYYYYNLSPTELSRLNQIIGDILYRFLMVDENGEYINEYNPDNLWFFAQYVKPSYEKGTRETMNDLIAQSLIYAQTHESLADILFSEEYTRRIGYLAAREFELMKGFTDETVKACRTILSDTIAAGASPRAAAKALRERVTLKTDKGTDRFDLARANRIAQTEIPGALRKAKQDEQDAADIKYDIKSMTMPISAFKRTSRRTHMARSGKLVTSEEQRQFYSRSGNSINCYCSAVTVVVDKNGHPVAPGVVKKAIDMRERLMPKAEEA